jgi:hypothetical protein
VLVRAWPFRFKGNNVGIFKGSKRPKPPWDYLIEKGMATEDQYDRYEKAIADGDYDAAEAIEGETVSGIKARKKK